MLEVIDRPSTGLSLSDTELLDAYEHERREIRRHQARAAELLAEIDRRRCYKPYGYLSTACTWPSASATLIRLPPGGFAPLVRSRTCP